jgi:chaperonin GroES
MKIKPLGDRVAVQPDSLETMIGSIIVPDTAERDSVRTGVVLSTGQAFFDNGELKLPQIFPGERVLYGRYSGVEIKTPSGEEIILLREGEVLGIMES